MKKEVACRICIDGKQYQIAFRQNRTKFELYVDGKIAAHLNLTPDEENQEKDIQLGGKICQFVLYGDRPDLVVDGIMKYEEYREYKTQCFHRNVLLGLGAAQMLVGTFCGITWAAMQATGMYSVGGDMGLVFSLAFTTSGVLEVLLGIRKSRKLRENRS